MALREKNGSGGEREMGRKIISFDEQGIINQIDIKDGGCSLFVSIMILDLFSLRVLRHVFFPNFQFPNFQFPNF